MLQFVNAYAGPMLAVHSSGAYFIGGGSLDVPITASFQETWHHVAVVRNGTICTVYIDGVWKGTLTISTSNNPSGTIRLGRSDEIHQQFYGFLDDVAVLTAALSATRRSATPATCSRRRLQEGLRTSGKAGRTRARVRPTS